MSTALLFFVGNRQPSIVEEITSDGTPVDLTGTSVRFKMRAVGSSELKVDEDATIVDAPNGSVRYDWAANDVDTAGHYLIWWEVTTGSLTQDMNEALIEFRAHAPAVAYVELEEFKSTLELTGKSFADADILKDLVAASRAVDEIAHRRFYADPDAAQVRYYNAARCAIEIDDLAELGSLETDVDGDGTFETSWSENTDFVLEPMNALADGKPYERIRIAPLGVGLSGLSAYPRSVKLTGRFGWPTVPDGAKVATTIIANRYLLRARQAPFGILGVGSDGELIRISRSDPDVASALAPITRTQVLA